METLTVSSPAVQLGAGLSRPSADSRGVAIGRTCAVLSHWSKTGSPLPSLSGVSRDFWGVSVRWALVASQVTDKSRCERLVNACLADPRPAAVSQLRQELKTRADSIVLAPSTHVPFEQKAIGNAPVERWQSSRLDSEITRLESLRARLGAARDLAGRVRILDEDARVRDVFGVGSSTGVAEWSSCAVTVALARTVLKEEQMYLLKCMVAAGQDHLMEVQAGTVDMDVDDDVLETDDEDGSLTGGALKEALKKLVQFVEQMSGGAEQQKELQVGHGSASDHRPPNADLWERRLQGNVDDCGHEGEAKPLLSALFNLVSMLARMERFYSSVGGIVGYQLTSLELIKATEAEASHKKVAEKVAQNVPVFRRRRGRRNLLEQNLFHLPVGPDLASNAKYATEASAWGLQGLPQMGEIYPLGGAGDRLGLVDEKTGECLPVAMLPYVGRTLLEGLIRDLQAREYLYTRVTGRKCMTPVAIMTSAAKNNSKRMHDLCERNGWFGRGRANFRLFDQPLVPVVAAKDGRWLATDVLSVVLKPGGHGAIWKLAVDEGIFDWFRNMGRRAALVRQISNPLAGTDATLLALSGAGLKGNKKFGFASCERNVGVAEGVNVLRETRRTDGTWEYGVTCVEYTEFEKLGIADVPVSPDSTLSKYPANTNVLYVDLAAAEEVASSVGRAALPGMIMNLKKDVTYHDSHGRKHTVRAGRLECTMQNIADQLLQRFPHKLPPRRHNELDTFVLYNARRKVTSSAKRKRKPGDTSLHQTPDGSFFDLMRNSRDLLLHCGMKMPEMGSKERYLMQGPPFVAIFHPAIGPLWDVVRQKIQGGLMAAGAEVQLEVAEVCLREVHVAGSLLVEATNVMGAMRPATGAENGAANNSAQPGEMLLHYGEGCGRVRLERVEVRNKGIDWDCLANTYWQNRMQRHEALRIHLHEDAEFEACGVTFVGSHTFEVPAGHRLRILPIKGGGAGAFDAVLEKKASGGEPTWCWKYSLARDGEVKLSLVESLQGALVA